MTYYFAKTVDLGFDDAVTHVTEALAHEGFGVLATIDVRETMKKKLDVDFRPYVILGACNPGFAYKALQAEDKIGAMLPCNVVVQRRQNGTVEVAAVDPQASMAAVENEQLGEIAGDVRETLQGVISGL